MFLTPRQAAARLNVSLATVYRLLADGRLGHIRLSARLVRIPVAALDALCPSAPAPILKAGSGTTLSSSSEGAESTNAPRLAPPLPKRGLGKKRCAGRRSTPTHSDGSPKFY